MPYSSAVEPIVPGAQWLLPFGAVHQPVAQLVCFHCAGAGASAFSTWPKYLPRNVQLLAAQLPGRERRYGEPPSTSVREIADRVGAALPVSDLPCVLYGHSVGAVLAYELAQRLCELRRPPTHLIVAGRRAPQLAARESPANDLSDTQLIARVASYGGTPAAVLQEPDLMQRLLPILRADFALADGHEVASGCEPLPCSILALGGDRDARCSKLELEGWSAWTRAEFVTRHFAGGHFFMNEHPGEFFAALNELLREVADVRHDA